MRYRIASSLVKLGYPLLSIAAAKRLSSMQILRRCLEGRLSWIRSANSDHNAPGKRAAENELQKRDGSDQQVQLQGFHEISTQSGLSTGNGPNETVDYHAQRQPIAFNEAPGSESVHGIGD
jgi:hypothetical protein